MKWAWLCRWFGHKWGDLTVTPYSCSTAYKKCKRCGAVRNQYYETTIH